MSLQAVGYGSTVAPVGLVIPSAHANRVLYTHRAVDEWYANGPAGLEQGFTVRHAPSGAARGPLTLSVALSGDAHASLERDGQSIVFARAGRRVLRYSGLSATDARGNAFRSWLQLAHRHLLIRVDMHGARFPVRIDPLIQSAELTASGSPGEDGLGSAVAISGNTIVAGAPDTTVGSHVDQGAALVFVKPASGWANATETAELTASDGAADDRFGQSVAISGETIAIGAPGHEYEHGGDHGAVYVFKPASSWATAMQSAELTASEAGPDEVGAAVAVSGDTIVAGAPLHHPVAGGQGEAFVFVKPASGWANATQTAELTPPVNGAIGDACCVIGAEVGASVAISGSTIVIGAPGRNNLASTVAGEGAVYVFEEPDSGWANSATPTAELAIGNGVSDELGASVAISGATIVAGAPGGDEWIGEVYVFSKPGSGWADATPSADLSPPSNESGFGESVAMSGATVVAGAPRVDSGAITGTASVFFEPETGWANAGPTTELSFGGTTEGKDGLHGVAVSGNTIVAGDPELTPGAAFVFSEPEDAAPSNLSLPSATGIAQQGATLTVTPGGWTGEPTEFDDQWLLCNHEGAECTEIANATEQTYEPTGIDVGKTLRVRETASNSIGPSLPATSAATAPVLPERPANTAPPKIIGTSAYGHQLTEQPGRLDEQSHIGHRSMVEVHQRRHGLRTHRRRNRTNLSSESRRCGRDHRSRRRCEQRWRCGQACDVADDRRHRAS